MNRVKRYLFVSACAGWYYSGTCDKTNVKKYMFNKGRNLSQRFKKYPIFDNVIEPIIVRQSTIIFCAGNAFLKGLISDNNNTTELEISVEYYKKEIESDLKEIE